MRRRHHIYRDRSVVVVSSSIAFTLHAFGGCRAYWIGDDRVRAIVSLRIVLYRSCICTHAHAHAHTAVVSAWSMAIDIGKQPPTTRLLARTRRKDREGTRELGEVALETREGLRQMVHGLERSLPRLLRPLQHHEVALEIDLLAWQLDQSHVAALSNQGRGTTAAATGATSIASDALSQRARGGRLRGCGARHLGISTSNLPDGAALDRASSISTRYRHRRRRWRRCRGGYRFPVAWLIVVSFAWSLGRRRRRGGGGRGAGR